MLTCDLYNDVKILEQDNMRLIWTKHNKLEEMYLNQAILMCANLNTVIGYINMNRVALQTRNNSQEINPNVINPLYI